MVKVDVVRAKAVNASITENRKKLKTLCRTVNEIAQQMAKDNHLHRIRTQLDRQLEELEQDLYLLGQMNECLQEILPMYVTCEEKTAVYAEESQVGTAKKQISFMEYEIPERFFQWFG